MNEALDKVRAAHRLAFVVAAADESKWAIKSVRKVPRTERWSYTTAYGAPGEVCDYSVEFFDGRYPQTVTANGPDMARERAWKERRRVVLDVLRRMLPAESLLDGLSAIDRARTAAALTSKVKAYAAAAGLSALERLRLAREIRELVAQLGGNVTAPERAEVQKLLALARGAHDAAGLAEVYGLIQEAMNALREAGAEDQAAVDAANAAITHWAEQEELANV